MIDEPRKLWPRVTTPADMHLPWVDYSTLAAVNMCPRWGIINSYLGLRFGVPSSRAMALEAGSAMHEMFAAVRMFELMEYRNENNVIPEPILLHGERLFASAQFPDRWNEMMQIFDQQDDYKTRLTRFALTALETSGFYDDPADRKRTQTNLETSAISYIDRYPLRRYIPVYNAETGFVGVEVGVDVVIPLSHPVRFVGKVDGVCMDTYNNNRIEVHENKTGSRIDSSWEASFTVGHQPTGYAFALSTMLGLPIRHTTVWGTQIPIPKTSLYGDGQKRINVSRTDEEFQQWIDWVEHTWEVIRNYTTQPHIAPIYTHSCNRYFSACPLIPLCAETREQRKYVIENEMIVQRWSPLDELKKDNNDV